MNGELVGAAAQMGIRVGWCQSAAGSAAAWP